MDYYNKPSPQTCLVLAHHGILGQKWGKRNGPPYPLGASDHSASEKKAGWRKSLEGSSDESKSDKSETVSSKKSEKESSKKKGLTSKQKKIIAGVAIALAVYGTYKLADSGELHRLAEKGKSFLGNTEYPTFKRNDAYSKAMSADEIADTFFGKINPGYDNLSTFLVSIKNCRRCTFAYELSRRGYDVKATNTFGGTGQHGLAIRRALGKDASIKGIIEEANKVITEEYGTSLKGLKDLDDSTLEKLLDNIDTDKLGEKFIKRISVGAEIIFDSDSSSSTNNVAYSTDKIFKYLSKMPDRARGELGVTWGVGRSGHSMAWEVIDGKPVIIDCQVNKMYKTASEMAEQIKDIGLTHAEVNRLDNVDLDLDFLKRWVTNDD